MSEQQSGCQLQTPSLQPAIAQPPGTITQRLDVSTLWIPCLENLLGLVVPLVVGLLFAPFLMIALGMAGVALLTAAYHGLRYYTVRFHVTENELIIESGLIHRRERRIPFGRIQETNIHQGLVHRLFGTARLQITTAGSDIQEASLDVITIQHAEQIKSAIDDCEGLSAGEGGDVAGEDFRCELSKRDLALGGLTSNLVASIGAVIATILYFQLFLGVGSQWAGRIEQRIDDKVNVDPVPEIPDPWHQIEDRIPDLGPLDVVVEFYLNETLAKSLALVVLGLVGAVVSYVIRYHGFSLTRKDELLTTSYGLISLHRNSIPRGRIQALKLEEGLLRRPFRLAAIRVDSAGDHHEVDEAKKRDVLVPVASRHLAHAVAGQAFPQLGTIDPDWQRVSRLAIMRGSKKGWFIAVLVILQSCVFAGWYTLAMLPAFPLIYFLNDRWYRNTGYWLGEDYFLARKGWLNRSTICLPTGNIQNITVRQSYFDRRLGLATLVIDTAGQSNTGGGPVLRHLPLAAAREIQVELAQRARGGHGYN